MAAYFFDTSAFVKRYHPEVGTAAVMAIFAEPQHLIRISTLSLLEMQSVFALKVRTNVITRDIASNLRARMLLDMAADAFEVFRLTDRHLETAQGLLGSHSFTHRLRTLDAIQLAVALDLKEQGLLDTFVVSDKALADIGAMEGFEILNPETTR